MGAPRTVAIAKAAPGTVPAGPGAGPEEEPVGATELPPTKVWFPVAAKPTPLPMVGV